MKHTPGPWHVGGIEKCTIYDKRSQRVANSFEGVMVTHRSDAECQANARLIAAAPDMYDALKRIAEGCSFPADEVQRAIRDTARIVLAKVEQ